MASELERLLISLDADTRKLRLALSQSETGVSDFERKADRSLGKVESRFSKLNGAASAQLQQLGAAVAAAFGAQALKGSLVDTAELERAAALAGLTTTELQKLHVAAMGAGVGAGSLNDAMKELASKIGEVKTRSGGFYEFLARSLPTVDAQIRGTKSTAEAMDVVAETVRRLSSAEERALFIKQALGEQGLQLTSTLVKGAAGLREASAEAEKYGQVLSEQAIKNTTALNKELDALGKTLDVTIKEKIGSVAPMLTKMLSSLRGAFAGASKGWQEVMQGLAEKGGTAESGAAVAKEFLTGWDTTIKQAAPSDSLKMLVKMPDFDTQVSTEAADAMSELQLKTLQATGETFAAIGAEYDRDVERFRRMLADKKIDEREFQQAREQLSIAASEKIKAAYDKEREHVRLLGESFSASMENSFGDAFSQLLEKGKIDFGAFTASLLADIAKIYIQSQLIKPLVGSIGSMLSGGLAGIGGVGGGIDAGGWLTSIAGARAAGGPVSAGKSYLVGERGPEVVQFGRSGMVTPNSGIGGATYNIDARGAEIGVEERVRAILMEQERMRKDPVSAVSGYRSRFPTRRAA